MSEAKQRVFVEIAELREKVKKLQAFLTSEAFKKLDEDNQILLVEQGHIMNAYLIVLVKRISIWKELEGGEENE